MSTHIPKTSVWGSDPSEVRRCLIREMNRANIYRLEGEYSGGHDEGGLDDLSAFDKAGEAMEFGENREAVHQAVEDLLSTKFYTWALGCSVYGHVYVDLREKRAWTEGSVETMEYVEDGDPIEMSL